MLGVPPITAGGGHTRKMQFAGILPEDAPDPRLEMAERLKAMPVPVMGFVPQPTLEDADQVGLTSGDRMMAVSITYTLWRNPGDRSDPVNLAELDESTRRALDEEPPWPRPAWILDAVERMRYRTLWEAVRTTWHGGGVQHPTLTQELTAHVRYLLMNRFREQHGIDGHDWDSPALPSEHAVRQGVPVMIDGEAVPGAEMDTDPFVYAVGAPLPTGGFLTAVVPREDLPYVTMAFGRRHPPESPG